MKALIVGFGSIGMRHYKVLSNILGEENVHVVTRRPCEIEYNFASLDEVRNICEYDYFVIASKTIEHYNDLIHINSRVTGKKILVEKPLFDSGKAKFKVNNDILVAYNIRFHPLVHEAKKIVGDRFVISANFYAGQYLPTWRPNRDYRLSYSAIKSEGGGILLDYSHDIDLLNYFLGDIQVFESFNDKISNLDISSDDYLTMFGKTIKNTFFSLSIDSISKIQKRTIQLNLEDETMELDLINNVLSRKNINNEVDNIEIELFDRNSSFDNMHRAILKTDYSCVASLSDGLKLTDMFEMIRNTSDRRKW